MNYHKYTNYIYTRSFPDGPRDSFISTYENFQIYDTLPVPDFSYINRETSTTPREETVSVEEIRHQKISLHMFLTYDINEFLDMKMQYNNGLLGVSLGIEKELQFFSFKYTSSLFYENRSFSRGVYYWDAIEMSLGYKDYNLYLNLPSVNFVRLITFNDNFKYFRRMSTPEIGCQILNIKTGIAGLGYSFSYLFAQYEFKNGRIGAIRIGGNPIFFDDEGLFLVLGVSLRFDNFFSKRP
ncbi:hypothetical protein QA601_13735 [Chitinispirillales bacterium ANBcel5]|uniref:hypothetical protein n=1 Tax=Cellulosispirillum alkaliphilum TaxID=3039283 RepID=UPI002A57CCC1|nr:hypothetical protein [Chitinispirillales bacterium ANBcel5]